MVKGGGFVRGGTRERQLAHVSLLKRFEAVGRRHKTVSWRAWDFQVI
jgi:hypothetical protein